jgi:hypothetical protein
MGPPLVRRCGGMFGQASASATDKFALAQWRDIRLMSNSRPRMIATAFGVLSWLLYVVGLLVCLAAIGCWAYQGYLWFKKGTWLPLPVSRYVSLDSTGWLELDQVIKLLLDVNLGYPIFIVGVAIMAFSLFLAPSSG